MKTLLNVLVVVIGFGGIVAVVIDDIVLAVMMLTASVLWLGFFVTLHLLLAIGTVMQDLTERIDSIWQNVYEHWPRR